MRPFLLIGVVVLCAALPVFAVVSLVRNLLKSGVEALAQTYSEALDMVDVVKLAFNQARGRK